MKILVVRNDKLGDFITALPALYILKKHLPHAHIAVLIAPINESVALMCDFIDELIIDEGQSAKELSQLLKMKNFELSFTLFSNTRVALAQFLARIPVRVAPATKIAQIFYTKRIRQRRSEVRMAEFEYNIELIRAYYKDMTLRYPQPLCVLNLEEKKRIFHECSQALDIKREVVLFHPGFGGSSDANWSVEEYIALAQSIEGSAYEAVFSFGPGDEAFLEGCQALGADKRFKFY